LGYVLAFNLLPGVVIARLLLPRLHFPGIFAIYALAIGTIVNVVGFLPLWMLGLPWLFHAFPAGALICLVAMRKGLGLGEVFGSWTKGQTDLSWAVGAVLLCGTPLLTMAYLLANDSSGAFSLHFAFQGVVVRSLAMGWPPVNLSIAGLKLSYHYCAHLWILAAYQNTGLDLGVLVARYGPLYFLGCAGAAVLAFGRFVLNLPAWIAGLPVVSVFGIIGVPPIFGRMFGTFTPFGTALIMSPGLGFLVFLVAVTLLVENRRRKTTWRGLEPAIIGILTFIGTGSRGVVGPILVCALALLFAMDWRRSRTISRGAMINLICAVLGLLAALALFFTLGSEFSGTGFVKVTGQPANFLAEGQVLMILPSLLERWGIPSPLAGAGGFLVIAIFQAGFLTAIFYYGIWRLRRAPLTDGQILLIGTSVAGIAATFMTQAPGHSHFSFLQYAGISMSLLGAQALDGVLQRFPHPGQGNWAFVGPLMVALCAMSLVLQLSEFPAETLSWLARHGRTAVAETFVRPTGTEILNPYRFACTEDRAPDDLLKQVPTDAIVVIVPTATKLSRACEYFWAFEQQPRASVNLFTLGNIPGQLNGVIAEQFTKRSTHLLAAANQALGGHVAASDLIAIARTLPSDVAVFVLLASNIQVDPDAQILRVAQQGDVTLLKIQTSAVARGGDGKPVTEPKSASR
jgi:hypothetical protein